MTDLAHPTFVQALRVRDADPGSFAQLYRLGGFCFHAPTRLVQGVHTVVEVSEASGPLCLAAISKQGRNPFGDMITIGRAASNDVILPFPGVSSFHAYVQCVSEARLLHDADSTCGTYVGARCVRRGEPVAFASGEEVRLGPLRLTYLSLEAITGERARS